MPDLYETYEEAVASTHESTGFAMKRTCDDHRGVCEHGHPWNEQSPYLRPDNGRRTCAICAKRRDAERNAKVSRERAERRASCRILR
jgi:hypothetical protein